jgi:Periplasmic copper-binding protein (NosD)
MKMHNDPRALCCALSFFAMAWLPQNAFAGKSLVVPSEKMRTITAAMSKAASGDTIWVEDGVYGEHVVLNSGVTLKARSMFKAIIDGQKRGTVVTMGKKSSISGFEIRNGTIGVFSKSFGCAVTQCRIVNNYETGFMSVRNCPRLEDNIIAFNGASGVQIYDARLMSGSISHNTIAYNGNHGIAVGGTCTALIENNIIAFNERFGVSVEDKSKELRVVSNDIYSNLVGSPPAPPGNFSFDPVFASPRAAFDFKTTSPEAENQKGSDNEKLGTRFIY